eukprot:TRINITY_DN2973_c0_g1_i4.p1 TRINITY_DN2973_c0_g1~~TRINITY_DN2973_c0_g1_i4.p1  ORF type:complete len:304 (-),score=53.49 TRINITY_DN2973_c0_g1_i4:744-1634(-)
MSSSEGVTIEEYVRRWGEKLLNSEFAPDEEKNQQQGADYLFSLLKRISSRGEKDDIQAPFRELRDIITEIYATPDPEKGRRINLLFEMYQGVFDHLTPAIYAGAKSGDMSLCNDEIVIMEQLRLRFYKLVSGETWKDYPDLRIIALRYMVRFMEKGEELRVKLAESMGITIAPPDNKDKYEIVTPTTPKFGLRQLSHKVTGPQKDTWENTFEDLVKMPSERMFPLVRILLEYPDLGKLKSVSVELEQPKMYNTKLKSVQQDIKQLNMEERKKGKQAEEDTFILKFEDLDSGNWQQF